MQTISFPNLSGHRFEKALALAPTQLTYNDSLTQLSQYYWLCNNRRLMNNKGNLKIAAAETAFKNKFRQIFVCLMALGSDSRIGLIIFRGYRKEASDIFNCFKKTNKFESA